MFIVSITYKAPLEQIDKELTNHVEYLKQQYSAGNFIASGRIVPRTGGIIMSGVSNKEVLEDIIKQDPFYKNGLSEYNIIEFIPSMTSNDCTCLLNL